MGIAYTKLQYKDEIRLVRLEPGTGNSQVKFNLVHARLGESPSYDALSYMWGEGNSGSDPLCDIEDGRTLEVRQNLGDALRHLRRKDEVRVLWVDAVCIDQRNDDERGHQVAQMGIIYSQATTVRVWLGMPDQSTSLAFRFLSNPFAVHNMRAGSSSSSEWEAVARLCEREYWGRLWIIQEVVLAARIDIHCGDQVLPWEAFSRVLFVFEECFWAYQNPTPSWVVSIHASPKSKRIVSSPAMKICQQRRSNTDSGPARQLSSLMSLLWTHKAANCEDVRDKVYGLQSFAPECCRVAVPADYSCSAFSLCHRLLEHDISCHVTGVEGRENFVRTSRELHQLILGGALRQSGLKRPFELGNLDLSPPPYKEMAGIEGSSNAFRIFGRKFGEVVYVSPPLSALFMDNATVRVPAAMLRSFSRTGLATEDVEDSRLTKQIVMALSRIWGGREENDYTPTDEQVVPGMRMIELDDSSSKSTVARGFENLMRFASEFLRTATFLRNTTDFEPSVMVMVENGRDTEIAFAPVGTQLGDIICAYKDTDVVSVVRRAVESYSVIGEASLLRGLEAPSVLSFTGQPIFVRTDMLSVQIFSRIPPVCDLPDYRAVLEIAPRTATGKMHFMTPFRGIHRLAEVLSTPEGRRRMVIQPTSIVQSHGPASRSMGLESIAEDRPDPQALRSTPIKHACPRCKTTFSTTRDKLRHAATWSHQQCGKCERWTSWPAPNASNSKTPFCAICRTEDPKCAINTPPLLEESEWKSPWWTTDSPTLGRNSMSDSEDWSQIATSGSDKQSRTFDELEMTMLQGRRSYLHTRSHVCDHNCLLSRGNSKDKEVDKSSSNHDP